MDLVNTLNWQEAPTNAINRWKNADVSLSVASYQSKAKKNARFVFTFRNDVYELIASDGEKISYAVGFGIIAFKKSEKGWSFSKTGNEHSRRVQFTVTNDGLAKTLMKMIGDYDLKEDDSGIYYISR